MNRTTSSPGCGILGSRSIDNEGEPVSENQPHEPIAIESVPVSKQSHTRTILEIVGGVVAVGLIFFSGAAGFVLGHVTAKHDGHRGGPFAERQIEMRGGPGLQGGFEMHRGQGFTQPGPAMPQQ